MAIMNNDYQKFCFNATRRFVLRIRSLSQKRINFINKNDCRLMTTRYSKKSPNLARIKFYKINMANLMICSQINNEVTSKLTLGLHLIKISCV